MSSSKNPNSTEPRTSRIFRKLKFEPPKETKQTPNHGQNRYECEFPPLLTGSKQTADRKTTPAKKQETERGFSGNELIELWKQIHDVENLKLHGIILAKTSTPKKKNENDKYCDMGEAKVCINFKSEIIKYYCIPYKLYLLKIFFYSAACSAGL